ncbi:MAG: prephenate dehydrogenase/arogenate dehydrogenase family protein [Acidobacteriota bacterium]
MSQFRRVAIIGVGMIGATLGRALRRAQPDLEIWGYDPQRPPESVPTGVQHWANSAEQALHGADLVILATPLASILDLMPVAARACGARALVTDAGSTKSTVCAAARRVFTDVSGPHFLGGHPMAGRERGGAAASDPDLLRGAAYALCPDERVPEGKRRGFEELVCGMGAHPLWIEPDDHDRIASQVSHLPQLVIVALASLLDEAAGNDARVAELAGCGLKDLLRLASSPYAVWHDICRTNTPALRQAIEAVVDRLQAISRELHDDGDLSRWFEAARHFREERLQVEQ